MIVYRDRTFCTQETCKHFADCSKAATDRVHAKAKLHGLPLSLIAFEECFEPIKYNAQNTRQLIRKQYMKTLNTMIGHEVIVRTYSAGVWFGTLAEKAKDEVILEKARMLWSWKAKEGIALSSVAMKGIDPAESRVERPVDAVWLQAIAILPCTQKAIDSIEGAAHAAPR